MADELDTFSHRWTSAREAMLTPIIPAMVVAAFGISPITRYLDPAGFLGAASALSTSLVLFAMSFMCHSSRTARASLIAAGVAALVGLIWFALAVTAAQSTVDRHRAQCRALQIDMGLLRPRRPNSAELFDALGCDPQDIGTIQFQAATARVPPAKPAAAA